jgi:hypothetical protein
LIIDKKGNSKGEEETKKVEQPLAKERKHKDDEKLPHETKETKSIDSNTKDGAKLPHEAVQVYNNRGGTFTLMPLKKRINRKQNQLFILAYWKFSISGINFPNSISLFPVSEK